MAYSLCGAYESETAERHRQQQIFIDWMRMGLGRAGLHTEMQGGTAPLPPGPGVIPSWLADCRAFKPNDLDNDGYITRNEMLTLWTPFTRWW